MKYKRYKEIVLSLGMKRISQVFCIYGIGDIITRAFKYKGTDVVVVKIRNSEGIIFEKNISDVTESEFINFLNSIPEVKSYSRKSKLKKIINDE